MNEMTIFGCLKSKYRLKPKEVKAIESFDNIWGDKIFAVYGRKDIAFKTSIGRGDNPFEDHMAVPLEKLCEYAEGEGITLNGRFKTRSSNEYFNDIGAVIQNNQIRYGNSEVMGASNDDLLEELHFRGVL